MSKVDYRMPRNPQHVAEEARVPAVPEAQARGTRLEARATAALAAERVHRSRSTVDSRELPGRGLVHKVKTWCPPCAKPSFYFASDDDERIWCADPPVCESCVYEAAIAPDDPVAIVDKSADFDAERARFKAAWPMLAEALEPLVKDFITPLRYGDRFKLGEITYPKVKPRFAREFWRDCLIRHSSGDHGEIGSLAEFKPTDDQLWLPEITDLLARNARAIAKGDGIVRSRFEVPADQIALIDPAWLLKMHRLTPATAGDLRIDVATLLTPGRPPRTHVRLERFDASCFRQHDPLTS